LEEIGISVETKEGKFAKDESLKDKKDALKQC